MEENKEKSVFDIFDRGSADSISKEDTIQALRVYGLNPTEEELLELFAELESKTEFCFKDFSKLIKKCQKISKVTRETVAQFFETFNASGDGLVDAEELKAALMTSGDALNQDEID